MEKSNQMPGSFPGQPALSKFKVLPAHQFHYVVEVIRKREIGAEEAFQKLVKEMTDESKELVFIPVNNPNFHWSLLVYETKTKTFYHYDTLKGANYGYVKPLVKELLSQIHQTNHPDLEQYLLKRHAIKQGNGWDCRVAVIGIMRRIRELKFKQSLVDKLKYRRFRVGDDIGEEVQRQESRTEYLTKNGTNW
ncbi:4072_t:CDS:2 [Cetraspora pellucida]|uniref:4072_t:CDS:1 n=1 Tax=Cetraspora pellucida TaxID=1433469 RepID=A0ACA9NB60_9GLOM|nr:4072_t:CDS:2 [Cetraspora pellucida]